jgi:hypothetical protein
MRLAVDMLRGSEELRREIKIDGTLIGSSRMHQHVNNLPKSSPSH